MESMALKDLPARKVIKASQASSATRERPARQANRALKVTVATRALTARQARPVFAVRRDQGERTGTRVP